MSGADSPVRAPTPSPVPRIAATYAAAVVVDRVAAFLLVGLLAWGYGAGRESDAYFVAYWLPVTILAMVGEVAFALIVPELRETALRSGSDTASQEASALVAWAPKAALASSIFYLALLTPTVTILASRFDDDTRRLAYMLGAFFAPYVGLSIYTNIAGAVLAGVGTHRGNAFSLPMSTIAIAAATFGLRAAGFGLFSFPLGAAAGQAMAIGVAIAPDIRRYAHRSQAYSAGVPSARTRARTANGVLLALLSLPPLLLVGLERNLAGAAGVGSVALLAYGRSLLIVPGLIAAPLGNALIASHVRSRHVPIPPQVWTSLGWSMFYGFATSVALALSAGVLLEALYAHGAYSAADLERTKVLVRIMLLGFGGMFVHPLLVRVLQARRDLVILAVAALSALIYVPLVVPLSQHGTPGLAIAYAAATTAPGAVTLGATAFRARPPRAFVVGWVTQLGLAVSIVVVHVYAVEPRAAASLPTTLLWIVVEGSAYLALLWATAVPEMRTTVAWAWAHAARRVHG